MSVITQAYNSLTAIMTTALPTVDVIPGRTNVAWTKPAYLFVGCQDPTVDGPWNAVENGTRTWESLGAATQKEEFRIWMSLLLSGGKSSFAPLITLAETYLAAIESALRPGPIGTGDGTLGGVLADPGWCTVSFAGFQQGMNEKGAGLIAPIAVDCVHYDNPI